MSQDEVVLNQNSALVDVVDRLIDKGVVLQGDVMLSVADVDLVYLGLKLVLCSVDRLSAPPKSTDAPAPLPPNPPSLPVVDAPDDVSSNDTDSQKTTSAMDGSPTQPLSVTDDNSQSGIPDVSLFSEDKNSPASTYDVQNLDSVSGSAPSLLPAKPEREASSGLAQLVLTLVELLRELMERQAIRRMENGTVTEAEVERMGDTFMRINDAMNELKDYFDLDDDDLNLDLGPLGTLLER